MKILFKTLAVLMITASCTVIGWADNLDPANLHFGTGFNTVCAQGCMGDANKVLGTGFDIYNVSNGATIGPLTQSAPLLLILSVPNTVVGTISSTAISSVTFYSAPSNPATSSAGQDSAAATNTNVYSTGTYSFSNSGFTSGSIYDFLHLDPQTDSSNSFNNYACTGGGCPANYDPGATSFTVYVFDIYGGTLGANGLIQINFSSSLPLGTIAAGYVQSGGKNYDNAYTEAGIVSTTATTPEPASMALFGTGLVGLAGAMRRKLKK